MLTAGCAEWQGEVAARVGDTEITLDELRRDGRFTGAEITPVSGRVPTSALSGTMQIRIVGLLLEEELAARNSPLTSEDVERARTEFADRLQGPEGVTASDDLVRYLAAQDRLRDLVAADGDGFATAQELLDSDPETFTPVCVEIANAPDAEAANQLLDALRGTTPLGEAAGLLNVEVQSTCVTVKALGDQGLSALVEELADAEAGDIFGPVDEDAAGLLLVGRVSSIEEPDLAAATQAWEAEVGGLLDAALRERARTTSVFVDPRYGRWDPATLSVVSG
jgi:hypothetical protein